MSEQHLETPWQLPDLPAWRPLVALWGGLALLDVGHSVGASPVVQLATISVLVAGCSLGVSRLLAVCVAGIGWLLLNGFVVHDLGQLGFAGPGDAGRAVLLIVIALAAAGARR